MGATCGAEDAYTSRAPGFVTRVTQWVPHVEQKMLTLPELLGSTSVFSGVHVARSFSVLCNVL